MKKLKFALIPAACFLTAAIFHYRGALNAVNAADSFRTFTTSLFQNEITASTLNLHYTLEHPENFGITDYPISYGAVSEASLVLSEQELSAADYQEMLYAISYEDLSADNQLTFDVLALALQNAREKEIFAIYDEPLSPTVGIQAQLPVLLCEYRFQDAQDVENYLTLITQTDTYFASILEHEKSRSKAGLFMIDETLKTVVSQCRSFAETTSLKHHMLVTVFNEKLDAISGIDAKKKAEYKLQNLKAVQTHVLPAYTKLADGLNALAGTGKNPYGLCYLPSGKAYYESLLRSSVGTYLSVDAVERRIRQQLNDDIHSARTLFAKYPDAAQNSIRDGSFGNPTEILNNLQTQMQNDFPKPPNASFSVKYVHESLENFLSPAFYLTAPIDNLKQNVIYINNASVCSPLDLYTTLAHEGYPGHLYQNLYSGSKLSPVRSLFSFGGYTEGWATYVEMESFRYAADCLQQSTAENGSVPENAAAVTEFARLNRSVSLGISSLLDICIHYRGYTREQTAAFLSGLGFSPSGADSIYNAVLENPANYLKYYLGYLSFSDLRRYCSENWPEKFELKNFHEQILRIGPAPFPVVEKYLKQYYRSL